MIWLLVVYLSYYPFLTGGLFLPRWSRASEAPEISIYWVGCKNQPFNEVRAGSL
jgi:hypothetical protein